jgi:hypothetical protein
MSPIVGPFRVVQPADEPSLSDANTDISSESNISLPAGLQDVTRGSNITEAEIL